MIADSQRREPDWKMVIGGSDEAAWLADRDRKFGLATSEAARIEAVAFSLEERGALFESSPGVLTEVPGAAEWYVGLAAYSFKTLGAVKRAPKLHGLSRSAIGVVKALGKGEQLATEVLDAFSNWINEDLERLYPTTSRSPELAKLVVAQIVGGRIVGQGQNVGGEEAVVLAKTVLVDLLRDHNPEVEVDRVWMTYTPEVNLPARTVIRVGRRLLFRFVGGGDNPDIVVDCEGDVLGVGEIKGRKDLSNVWESWMPQVADHMRTWAQEFPTAERVLIGTVITQEMVDGASVRGVPRTGLKGLYADGHLTGVYNVSKMVEGDKQSLAAFDGLVQTFIAACP